MRTSIKQQSQLFASDTNIPSAGHVRSLRLFSPVMWRRKARKSEFKERRSQKRIQFIVLNNKKHRIKKNSIDVSQSKILTYATISFQIKPWRYEEMKNSDEKVNVKAFRDVRNRYLGGGRITQLSLYLNNNQNKSFNVIC